MEIAKGRYKPLLLPPATYIIEIVFYLKEITTVFFTATEFKKNLKSLQRFCFIST